MEAREEPLLEEGPGEKFRGATLQIQHDSNQCSRSPSSQGDDNDKNNHWVIAQLPLSASGSTLTNIDMNSAATNSFGFLKPAVSGGADIVSPMTSDGATQIRTYSPMKPSSLKAGYSSLCPVAPSSEEEAREFFVSRDNLVDIAIEESVRELLQPETDGELLGSWLLTEISLWDAEKERLILLSSRVLFVVKYDFIAMKRLDHRKIPLTLVDTLVIGELIYPPGSLVPRLNGLASGVVTVVKGCLLRPLQERWTAKQPDLNQDNSEQYCPSAFDYVNFEPRARNVRGVRAMWNRGEPLSFTKRWNPFTNEIPFTTYTSHPLLWHKGDEGHKRFDVEDFAAQLGATVVQASSCNGLPSCKIENAPIVLQNYVSLGSLIHNRNNLGFFKVRGKFSF